MLRDAIIGLFCFFSISSHAEIITAWDLNGLNGDETTVNASHNANHVLGLNLHVEGV